MRGNVGEVLTLYDTKEPKTFFEKIYKYISRARRSHGSILVLSVSSISVFL